MFSLQDKGSSYLVQQMLRKSLCFKEKQLCGYFRDKQIHFSENVIPVEGKSNKWWLVQVGFEADTFAKINKMQLSLKGNPLLLIINDTNVWHKN